MSQWFRNTLRVERCRIELPLGSGFAANRSARCSQARRFNECAALSKVGNATGDCDGLERRRQSHSLVAGPEINLFCNNKFV